MSKPPKRFTDFIDSHPAIGEAYQGLGRAAGEAGPLDKRTQCLVKVGIAIGAGLEGGTHSATRKALDAGCTPEEVRHAAILAVTTLGFPWMMNGLACVEEVLDGSK